MADISKTVEIIFGAVDQTGSAIGSVKNSFNDLDSSIQQVAVPVANLTKDLLAVEAAIIATGVAVTGLAISTAGEFQSSVSEVGTLLNLNAEQNSKFSESLLDYGRNASVALDDVVSSAYIAISTGTDLADVTTALSAAEMLAVAGATDLDVATGALSRTLNAYGLSANDAERVSNALFIAVQNGDTTMEELGSKIGRVASIASASSVSIEELLSAIAGITVSGVETSEAVTGLVALFKEFASPTDELSAALGGMSLESNSLQEIMQRLQEVTGGSFVEFNKLFGSIEATNAATILANDSTGAFANTLKAMEEETGNLAQAYEVMGNTFDRINQNLVNNLQATLIDAGTPLLDDYANSVSALGDVFKALSVGMESANFQKVNGALEEFIGQFNVTLKGIAEALPQAMSQVDFAGLISSFEGLAESVGEVFDELFGDNLDLTKPEDLALVLQKAVNGISALTDATSGVVDSFQPVFGAIGQILTQFNGLTADQQKFAGEIGGSAILVSELGTLLGGVAITLRETGASIQDTSNVIVGAGGIVFNTLQLMFDGFITLAAERAQGLFSLLSNLPDFLGGDDFEREAKEFGLLSEAAAANFKKNMDDLIASSEKMKSGLNGDARAAAEALREIPKASDEAAVKLNEDGTLINGSLSKVEEKAKAAGVSVGDYILALAKAGDGSGDLALTAEQVAEALEKTGDGAANAVEGIDQAKNSGVQFEIVIDELGNRTLVATDAMQGFSKGVQSAGDSSADSMKKVADLEKTMLELASDERIAAMEFSANIETEKIKAQTEEVQAAFEAISQSVSDTTQATVDLFSLFANADVSKLDKLEILDAAKRQQELQEKALEKEGELIDEKIRSLKAYTNQLESGQGLITINADNLAPELQQVLHSLINNIRVQATEQGLEMLLPSTS